MGTYVRDLLPVLGPRIFASPANCYSRYLIFYWPGEDLPTVNPAVRMHIRLHYGAHKRWTHNLSKFHQRLKQPTGVIFNPQSAQKYCWGVQKNNADMPCFVLNFLWKARLVSPPPLYIWGGGANASINTLGTLHFFSPKMRNNKFLNIFSFCLRCHVKNLHTMQTTCSSSDQSIISKHCCWTLTSHFSATA